MPTADPTLPAPAREVDPVDLVPLVDPDTVIDSGGNATLTRCRYAGREYLFKEFRPEYLAEVDEPALRALVAWRRDLPAAARDRLDDLTAWPRYVVRSGGGPVCGLLIPVAAPRFFRPRPTGGRTPRTFYDLLTSRRSAAAPLSERLTACAHLVRAVLWLHDLGVVVDDLQPDNILCAALGAGVYLVDCDSMVSPRSWGQVARPVAPEIMADLVPPGSGPDRATDLIKLTWVLVWVLLDRYGLVRAGDDEHAALRATISPDTADLLLGPGGQAPDVWRRVADGWLELAGAHTRPPESAPEAAATATARTTTAPAPTRPWLPPDLGYQPAPAPTLFPQRRAGPGRRLGRRMRPGVVAAVLAVLVIATAALIVTTEGWPL